MGICLPGECVTGFYYSNKRTSKILKSVLDSKCEWAVWVFILEFLCVFFISNVVGFTVHRSSKKGNTSSWNVDIARGFLSISDSLPLKHGKCNFSKSRGFLFIFLVTPFQMTQPFGMRFLFSSHFFFSHFSGVCVLLNVFSFVSHLTWQNRGKNISQL